MSRSSCAPCATWARFATHVSATFPCIPCRCMDHATKWPLTRSFALHVPVGIAGLTGEATTIRYLKELFLPCLLSRLTLVEWATALAKLVDTRCGQPRSHGAGPPPTPPRSSACADATCASATAATASCRSRSCSSLGRCPTLVPTLCLPRSWLRVHPLCPHLATKNLCHFDLRQKQICRTPSARSVSIAPRISTVHGIVAVLAPPTA